MTQSDRPEDSPEPTKSPFDFISPQDSTHEEKSGFSFLQPGSHDNEQESHDVEPKTHDQPPEIIAEPIQNPQVISHDKDLKSHDSKTSPVSKPAPRQLAPSKVKKKKKRAVRPGQSTRDESSDVDTISLGSHASSLDGSHYEEALSPDHQAEPPQTFPDHSVAQLVKLDSQDSQENAEKPTNQDALKDVVMTTIIPERVTNENSQQDTEKPTNQDATESVAMTTAKPDVVTREEEVSVKDEESQEPEVPKQESPPKTETPPTEVATKASEDVREELAEVFSQPNYSVEISDTDRLTMLLEGFESGLARIRWGEVFDLL